MLYVISDLHLGHKKIIDFSPERLGCKVSCVEEHDSILEERWRGTVHKKDTVLVLGDVAFTTEALKQFSTWPGIKHLVRGNHDDLNEGLYRMSFYKIYGLLKKHKMWFSHAPIHPQELRGCINVHGHVHDNVIDDPRYVPVCVEQCQGWPISIETLKRKING